VKRGRDPMQTGVLRLLQAVASLRQRIHRGQGSLLVDMMIGCAGHMSDEHAYALAASLVVAALGIVERHVWRT
jgi:hypothetical protein